MQINVVLSVVLVLLLFIILYHTRLQLKKLSPFVHFMNDFKNILSNVKNAVDKKGSDDNCKGNDSVLSLIVDSTELELPESRYFRDSVLSLDDDFKPIN